MKQTGNISKNAILAIAGLAVLIIVIYFVASGRQGAAPGTEKTGRESKETSETKEFAVTKKEVPANEAPSGFPSEVPIEAGAKITQNYEADTTDGRHQATRTFESSRTVAQNYQTYLNFLTQNGWEVTNKLQTDNLASVFGKKDDAELSATISKNSISGVVSVELSHIAKK